MAKSLAGNGVTQHDAAGVLTQVVGSGAFTGQAVAMVSRTAARMQENVGQSVDETIRQFKRLQAGERGERTGQGSAFSDCHPA